MGFFDKLKQGLSKTKQSFNDKVNNVFSAFRKVDEELLEELEEALIMSDVGVETSTKIIANLRDKIKKQNLKEADEVKQALREEIQNIFDEIDNTLHLDTTPSIILVETVDITGLVLTKLDGTAKGGVVIGITNENHMPVKFIGVGEQIDDMEVFNSKDFVKAIIE